MDEMRGHMEQQTMEIIKNELNNVKVSSSITNEETLQAIKQKVDIGSMDEFISQLTLQEEEVLEEIVENSIKNCQTELFSSTLYKKFHLLTSVYLKI